MTMPALMTATVIAMPEQQSRLRRAIDEWREAESQWQIKTLELAVTLDAIRKQCGGNNKAFGKWLSANGFDDLGDHDRAALIKIAEHFDIAKEVLNATRRKSLRLIWQEEIEPLTVASATNDKTETKPARQDSERYKLKVPEGCNLLDLVRDGLNMQRAGEPVSTIGPKLGLSRQAYLITRDLVLLSERDDLGGDDAAFVKAALTSLIETRTLDFDEDRLKAITARVWGARGNRLKSDKNRLTRFTEAISYILNACESACEIPIPQISDNQAADARQKLAGAVEALEKLRVRIKETRS